MRTHDISLEDGVSRNTHPSANEIHSVPCLADESLANNLMRDSKSQENVPPEASR